MSEAKAKQEIIDKLTELRDFLMAQSAVDDFGPIDEATWAADCLDSFLKGQAKTLDHAFGLKANRGRKPVDDAGTYSGWILDAWWEYFLADRAKEADTVIAARIGRKYGLGGKGGDDADSAVASQLKRELERYRHVLDIKFAADFERRRKL